MKYASPPIDPPADNRIECSECDGQGVVWVQALGMPAEVSCEECDGEGLVEWSPDDDPSAPDYWKDAL